MEWHASLCRAGLEGTVSKPVPDSSSPDPARRRTPHGLLIRAETPARRATLFSSIEQLFEILGVKY